MASQWRRRPSFPRSAICPCNQFWCKYTLSDMQLEQWGGICWPGNFFPILFAAIIGGDLPPGLGLPFYNGGTVTVVGQPGLGPGDKFEEPGILGSLFEFGPALPFFDPAHGNPGIR